MEISSLDSFQEKNILVIGDYCIDEFIQGDLNPISPISPESPILRITVDEIRTNPGMAGNIAQGVRALGANCYVAGVFGNDVASDILLSSFTNGKNRIEESGMVYQDRRITPKFTRVLAGGKAYSPQGVVRYDLENTFDVGEKTTRELIDRFSNFPQLDAIIVADYDEVGKGVVNETLLDAIRTKAKDENIFLIGDSRTNFKQFQRFTCIKPNRSEAEQLCDGYLENYAQTIINRMGLESLLVTKDSEGMDIFSATECNAHFPAYNDKPVCVDGVGDTVTCAFTLARISGMTYSYSAMISSYAAAVGVSKPGVDIVTLEELKEFILKEENK